MDAKTLQNNLESLGFTLSMAKPEIEKRLEDEEPAHIMIKQIESG